MDEKDMTLELELDDYLDRFYQEQEEKKQKQQASEELEQGQREGQGLATVLAQAEKGDSSVQVGQLESDTRTGASDAKAPGTRAKSSPEEHPDWRAAYRQRFDVRVYGSTVTQEEDDKAFETTVCQATRSIEINRSVFFGTDHDQEPTEEDLEKQDKVTKHTPPYPTPTPLYMTYYSPALVYSYHSGARVAS